jgi:hypothetical protein
MTASSPAAEPDTPTQDSGHSSAGAPNPEKPMDTPAASPAAPQSNKPQTLRLADFPEKEHLAGHGNWLYKIPFRDDYAVLKIYFGNRNPLLHWKKSFGNLFITGRTGHLPRTRCKVEVDCVNLWEKHGFPCFKMYPEVKFSDVPEGGYMLFDYVPGIHFRTYFRDETVSLEERMETWEKWLPIWHRRHKIAVELTEPRLIHENGDMKHVMLWKGDFVNFDFEITFRSKDIRDLVGREMLAYMRSIGKAFGDEMYDRMMDGIIKWYPDKALLMEAYIHGIENRNPVMRFFRLLDRTFRSANKKQYSKYNVAFDLKRRLDAAALN